MVYATLWILKVMLKLEQVRIEFETPRGLVRAVDDLSLELGPGKSLGIVGESGSGKSVLGLSLLQLLSPPGKVTSGTALFETKDLGIVDLFQASRAQMQMLRGNQLAMVFQDPMTALNPYLRIETQLIEALSWHQNLDASRARLRAVEALAAVGIENPEQRMLAYPHEFSGGMRQRVLIAMALLFISHDLAVVASLCSSIVVMLHGRIVETGTRTEVLQGTHRSACWLTSI